MPCPLLIFSQSDYLIQIIDTNSHTEWQTVQIQISWLLQKPTDLDLHCLQRQGLSGFSRTRVNTLIKPKPTFNKNIINIVFTLIIHTPYSSLYLSISMNNEIYKSCPWKQRTYERKKITVWLKWESLYEIHPSTCQCTQNVGRANRVDPNQTRSRLHC